jgi:hypothetical protein
MEYQYEVKFRKEGNNFKLHTGNFFEAEKIVLIILMMGFIQITIVATQTKTTSQKATKCQIHNFDS